MPSTDQRGNGIAPRFFSSRLSPGERRVYGTVTAVMLFVFLATLWPIHPLFSRLHPMLLGIPFSLLFLVILVAISFFSLWALYRWEERRGELE